MELREKYKNDIFIVWMNENYKNITERVQKTRNREKNIKIKLYKEYCEKNRIEYEKNKIA
jgi:hypothetical protein